MLKLAGLVVAAAVFEGAAAARPAVPVAQPGAISPPGERVQLYPPASDDLFGSLFEPPALPPVPALPPAVTLEPESLVYDEEAPDPEPCGILVIPAPSSVDPRMPRAFANPAVQHTIRVVPVPPCEPS